MANPTANSPGADFSRLQRRVIIGDKRSDILAGQRANVPVTVLVPSYQTHSEHLPEAKPTYVADNLYQAAQLIAAQCSEEC